MQKANYVSYHFSLASYRQVENPNVLKHIFNNNI